MRPLLRLLFVLLVIVAGSAIWWVDTLREGDEQRAEPGAPAHEPDYYFTDFRLRTHEAAGLPRYVLRGTRLVHYADDGSATVTAPDLYYRPDTSPPWTMTSETGRLAPSGDRVDMEGNVVMNRQPRDVPPLTLRTSRMTIYTDAGRAETSAPVTVTQPGRRMAAVGATARFGPGLIDLHSDVRGRYEPTSTIQD